MYMFKFIFTYFTTENLNDDRGDVPGWVMITLMSAILVAGLIALAGPALNGLFEDAIARVSGAYMSRPNADGAIVAESAMIIALVTLLCGTILQLGIIIHTKNTMIDVASSGARYAALADRNLADGQQRTATLLAASLPNTRSADIEITRVADGERIAVTVTHRVPILGFLTGPIPLSATAQAYVLTPQ